MSVTYESYHPTNAFGGDVIPSSSAHTKGSYLQFSAASGFDADGVVVSTRYFNASIRQYLADIATGPGGSETVIIANILMQGSTVHGIGCPVIFPVSIASGTRIAARAQQSGTGSVGLLSLVGIVAGDAAAMIGNGIAHTYGADTATTDGVAVDAGAVGATKGAYSEVTAATSTTDPLLWLGVFWRTQNSGSGDQAYMFDIAVGAAASETIIIPDQTLTTSTGNINCNCRAGYPVNIANGTRIVVRQLCGGTGAERVGNVVLIGVEGDLASGGGGSTGVARLVGPALVG